MKGHKMLTHKLTDTEIKVRIVPKRLRWPPPSTHIAWTKAHDCVDALQNLVRKVDLGCLDAERDRKSPASSIARRRTEVCDKAMTELVSFRLFQIAEKVVTEKIDLLERRTSVDAQQAQMQQNLAKALADLREGIEATKRMVLERCKMRECSRSLASG
jgi:hypothetical protein